MMIKWRLSVLFWITFIFAVVSFCHAILEKRTNEKDQKLKEKTSEYLPGEKKRYKTELGKEKDRKYQRERGIHTKYTSKEIERQQNELQGEDLKAFNERAQRYKQRRAAYDAKRYAKNKLRKAENQNSREEVKQKETRRKRITQKKTIVNTNTGSGSGSGSGSGTGTSSNNKVQKSTETMRTFAQADIMKANRLALEEIPFEFQPHKRPKKSDV